MRAALAIAVLVAGCRAEVAMPASDGGDLAATLTDGGDGSADLSGEDGPCAQVGPEICNNGCDDDRNGYVDEDDPACTPELLVTLQGGSPGLERLLLGTTPRAAILDTNPVPAATFAEYQRSFANLVYFVSEAVGTGRITTLQLADGGAGTLSAPYHPGYVTRDVCVFNGELIVVERGSNSYLHRMAADGMTETGMVALGSVFATSCASDGNLLYVAVHDITGLMPSQFMVFDKSFTQVGTLDLPAGISAAGLNRCLDFAWTRKAGFYGLFVDSTSSSQPAADSTMSAGQLWPFSFDGGVGAPVDAGVLHGIGEFIP